MRIPLLLASMAAACSTTCPAQSDMLFFIGSWEFKIWGSVDTSGPPALTGMWKLESGLDSAMALVGRVQLDDAPGVQGGLFTRELIAYDAHARLYTRSIVANTGSTYHFTSPGWQADTLVWSGRMRAATGEVELRETIERTGPDSFTAVFHRKAGDDWVLQSNERLTRR